MKHRLFFILSLLALLAMGLPTALPALVHGSSLAQTGPPHVTYLPLIQTENRTIIPPTTKVIDDTALQSLTSVSADMSTLTFAQTAPALATVQPGDVIVAGPSTAAPNGFLRKVLSISQQQGQVMLQTTNATLEEAITEGSLSLSQDLLPSQVQGAQLAQGVRMAPQLLGIKKDFELLIAHAVLYDADANLSTTDDQIVADGSVTLEMAFDIDLSIRNNELKTFTIKQRATQTTQLSVSSMIANYSGHREKKLAEYPFAPMTVFIGAVPLVFQPALTVTVGVSGDLKLQVITSVTQQSSSTSGLRYQHGSWSPIQDSQQNFQYIPPTLVATLNAEASTHANLEVMLYGMAGPYVHLKAYLFLTADMMKIPWWQLFAGLTADAGARLTVLSKTIASYERNLFDMRKLLAQADVATATSTPSPTSTPTRNPVSTPTPSATPPSTPRPTPTRTTGQTTRVSVTSNGMQALGGSSFPSISADGRYIAFYSYANNLVANDTNSAYDIFVHDRQTGSTTRVSITSTGLQANGDSSESSISADGRYVAFASVADNLVANDTNNESDVFVHDRQAGSTTRVSITSAGLQANSYSYHPSISADGRYVTFCSYASNLVANDTNAAYDIFVHDRQTSSTTRVSIASNGTQANSSSLESRISADGRYVAFSTDASNIVMDDTNGISDIFVYDRQTGSTIRASLANDGSQANGYADSPSMSADGRYITFRSNANNIVTNDTNLVDDIFVRDQQTGSTTRVSIASNGTQANAALSEPNISADGRFIAFRSAASNLVANDANTVYDIFVHDRQTGSTTRVSIASNGTQADGASYAPSVSADGCYIAFYSYAINLVADDTNGVADIFVHDRSLP